LLGSYALLLQRLNDPAALGIAEKATKLAPGQAQFADTYGWLLVQKGDLENGVRVLREARLREPNNGLIRWHLASALAKSGRTAEARDELQAALSSNMPPAPGPELTQLKAAVGL
jgi:cellulose synthase operon protein C